MSTATVSASRPADRGAGVGPPFAAGVATVVPFGLIDTGLPGAGRRGVGDDEPRVPTVVVGASGVEAGPGFADGDGDGALAPGFAEGDGALPPGFAEGDGDGALALGFADGDGALPRLPF
jgi:hypothetical protein